MYKILKFLFKNLFFDYLAYKEIDSVRKAMKYIQKKTTNCIKFEEKKDDSTNWINLLKNGYCDAFVSIYKIL